MSHLPQQSKKKGHEVSPLHLPRAPCRPQPLIIDQLISQTDSLTLAGLEGRLESAESGAGKASEQIWLRTGVIGWRRARPHHHCDKNASHMAWQKERALRETHHLTILVHCTPCNHNTSAIPSLPLHFLVGPTAFPESPRQPLTDTWSPAVISNSANSDILRH